MLHTPTFVKQDAVEFGHTPIPAKAFAAAVAVLGLVAISHSIPREEISSNSQSQSRCLPEGYKTLESKFRTASQQAKDQAWMDITYECVTTVGLPEDVDSHIDPDLQGQTRYMRVLSPTGY